jgi:hypothetical protein
MKNNQPFITTDLREEFEKRFPNIEVRIPDIEEYHTGKKAYDAIADFWLQKMSEHKERLIKEVEEPKYTFRKVEWETGIESMENEQDDTKCTAYCEGYNQAQKDILRRLQSV